MKKFFSGAVASQDHKLLTDFLQSYFMRPFRITYLSNSRRYVGLSTDDDFSPAISILVLGSDFDPWSRPSYKFLEIVEGIYPFHANELTVTGFKFDEFIEEKFINIALEEYLAADGGLFA